MIRGTVGADQGSAETLQEEFSASQTLALCRGGDVYRRRCRSTVRGRTKGLCRADEKLSELANESARTRVSVYGEVDTQGRSITEPAVSRRPIRAPPSPRTHPRRPCRTTWLQGHFTDHIQHLPSPMFRRTNMQAGGPFRRSSLVPTATSSGEARSGGPRLVRPCHVRVPRRCRRTCAGSARAPAEPLIGR